MATVFRKSYTQHLPQGAKIVQRKGKEMALWHDAKGRSHYDDVTVGKKGQYKIIRYTPTWTAQYRDADGQVVFESTGCRDEQAARHVLARLLQRVEHVKAGIITTQQYRVADHAERPLDQHVADYLEHLKAKTVRGRRVSIKHRENVKRVLERVVGDCHFKRLGDITRDAMERWMNGREADGMGARTRNTYRSSIVAFCNWCLETDRVGSNPLAKLCVADERGDRRRTRRALDEDEVSRLLVAARLRPLAEFGRETVHRPEDEHKGRRTWTKAPLAFEDLDAAAGRGRQVLDGQPEFIAELERLGRDRSLAYKAMVLTGLRKGELASLNVGQLELDAAKPYAELLAKDEKAGRGAKIPLRADLVADIRAHLADRLACLQAAARANGHPVPARLSAATPLVHVPRDFVRIFDRDLAAAGIAKADDRGRRVDIHALRHTFGTHLSLAGVFPRVAQAAMRHSTLELTMNIYTDPRLLDVAGAIDSLPTFAERLLKADPAKSGMRSGT